MLIANSRRLRLIARSNLETGRRGPELLAPVARGDRTDLRFGSAAEL